MRTKAGQGRPRLGLAGAGVLLGLAVLASACSSNPSGGSSAQTITLYSGQHEQTTNALVAAFEKKTGITVKVRNDDEDVLANQILTEGSASPADVIYTENSPALETLQERGRLSPVDPSTLAAVPAKYSSPQGNWVGVSARVSVMVYNTGQLSPRRAPELDHGPGRSPMEGKDRSGPGRVRLLPHRRVHRKRPTARRRRRDGWPG